MDVEFIAFNYLNYVAIELEKRLFSAAFFPRRVSKVFILPTEANVAIPILFVFLHFLDVYCFSKEGRIFDSHFIQFFCTLV